MEVKSKNKFELISPVPNVQKGWKSSNFGNERGFVIFKDKRLRDDYRNILK